MALYPKGKTGLLQAEAYFYSDNRKRSTSDDPNYTPPPPIPTIKLEMVEEDLMEYVGKLVGKNVVLQKRQTTANKSVYRVTIQARGGIGASHKKKQKFF